ncbi:hypothetical protein [Zooshikella sp. RANM57]|uniref:hypothetical protein n=1 Tax=Zooshikella sp. RANM57 TaxID=3425863 RepID=UPI003D6E8432
MKRIITIILLSVFILGCDTFYYPKIRNDFDTTIKVNIKYSSGEQLTHDWPPCLVSFIGRENKTINEIKVFKGDKNIIVLSKEKIAEMAELENKNAGGYSVWGIGPDGVNFYTKKKECFQNTGSIN